MDRAGPRCSANESGGAGRDPLVPGTPPFEWSVRLGLSVPPSASVVATVLMVSILPRVPNTEVDLKRLETNMPQILGEGLLVLPVGAQGEDHHCERTAFRPDFRSRFASPVDEFGSSGLSCLQGGSQARISL